MGRQLSVVIHELPLVGSTRCQVIAVPKSTALRIWETRAEQSQPLLTSKGSQSPSVPYTYSLPIRSAKMRLAKSTFVRWMTAAIRTSFPLSLVGENAFGTTYTDL